MSIKIKGEMANPLKPRLINREAPKKVLKAQLNRAEKLQTMIVLI